jgi:hypothetical protein
MYTFIKLVEQAKSIILMLVYTEKLEHDDENSICFYRTIFLQ